MPAPLTVLDEDRQVSVSGDVASGRVLLVDDALTAATGWTLKPEGLCRNELCVPLLGRDVRGEGGLLDVERVAETLGRPYAVELDGGAVIALGPRAEEAPGVVRAGDEAPDFTLETLDGDTLTFSDLGGSKRVLFCWASW